MDEATFIFEIPKLLFSLSVLTEDKPGIDTKIKWKSTHLVQYTFHDVWLYN